MVKTIGNPLSWAAQGVSNAGHAMGDATGALGSPVTTPPKVRQITNDDLRSALRKGYGDFGRFRSDVMFLVLIYPVIGLCLAAFAFHQALLPMLFPLGAGFVLLGPIAAIGLYELSRQAETRDDVDWRAAVSVMRARNIGPVLVMAVYLLGLFVLWLLSAMQIYNWTLGPAAPASAFDFAITVSFGSILGASVMSPDTHVTVPLVALAALFALQIGLAQARVRFGFVDRILENTPLLVMEGREVLDDNLAKADMTRQDLWAKLREANVFDLDVVRAVIVERSGEVNVLYDDGLQRTMSDEPLSDVRR